jgi:hypothetical protein
VITVDYVLNEAAQIVKDAELIARGEPNDQEPHKLLVDAAKALRDASNTYVTKDYPHRLAFYRWLADHGQLNETDIRREP